MPRRSLPWRRVTDRCLCATPTLAEPHPSVACSAIHRGGVNSSGLESCGDKLNHESVRHPNESFVTPLDREDIVGLASRIDDITDVCYDVSELVLLFKVTSIRPPAVRQSKVLVTAASEVLSM